MTNPILSQFEANLQVFFNKVEDKLEAFAKVAVPKVENLLEVAFEDLAEIAGEAVLGEATKLISGQEKFGNAVTNVVQTVEASGKTVAIQTAQAAVQVAYLSAKQVAAQQ